MATPPSFQSFPKATKETASFETDPFYAKPAAQQLAAVAPGTILRVREIEPRSFYFFQVDAKAWQVMFRSNDGRGQPVASITTVLVPPNAPAKQRVLLSYQMAYDGLTLQCAPSQSIVRGQAIEQMFVNDALKQGWVVSVPDYEGLDSLWGAAVNSGQGVLDSIRAVSNFSPVGLAGAQTKVGLFGYSGGALASTWAAELHPLYAPEIKLVGAGVGGVPIDIGNVARKVDGGLFSGLYLTMVVALSRAYPEIKVADYINDRGMQAVDKAQNACAGQFMTGATETLWAFSFEDMASYIKVPDLLLEAPIQKVIEENRLGKRAPQIPLYVFLGTRDQVMLETDNDAWVSSLCKAGLKVQYKKHWAEHVLMMPLGYPDARDYLRDRFAGKAAPSNCP